MKRLMCLFLVLFLFFTLFAFSSCTEIEQNNDPITLYVALGNNQLYYEAMKSAIKTDLGIDVQFIFQGVDDTTNALNKMLQNQDVPADIIFTGSASPEEALLASCVNFYTETNLTNLFSLGILNQETCSNGGIYQLPITSRLIGITYNETLLNELGMSVPSTFNEMLALKTKCDEEGILFAVSGGVATGHGFNWLFHLMGSEWLSSLEGAEWLDDFLLGNASIDAFEKASLYFKEYAEAGLFGKINTTSWYSSEQFSKQRALFLYDLTNNVYSYNGLQFTEDGRIQGASYDSQGNLLYYEKNDGIFVLVDNTWVLYDAANEAHASLTRYDIPGAVVLHDTYKSMPWISRDGTTNNFTYYHNCYASLNKKLLEQDQKNRFENCISILTYLTSEKATSFYISQFPDGYISLHNFSIDNHLLYGDYQEQIIHGFIQPWYYNLFDSNTIMKTGDLINRYLAGDTTISFFNIIDELESNVQLNLDSKKTGDGIHVIGEVKETLDFCDVARLEAISGAINLQEKLSHSGLSDEITVSLLPYIDTLEDFPLWNRIPVINSKLYAGKFESAYLGTITVSGAKNPLAVYLTGKEINQLLSAGYIPNNAQDGSQIGSFPFALVTKGNQEILDDQTYLVAINETHIPSKMYEQLKDENRILLISEETLRPGVGLVSDGIISFFKLHPTITKESITW